LDQSNCTVFFSASFSVPRNMLAAATIFAVVSCALPDAVPEAAGAVAADGAAADPAAVVVPAGDDPDVRVPTMLAAGDAAVVAAAVPVVPAARVAVAPTVVEAAALVVGEPAVVGAGAVVGVAEPPHASSNRPIAAPAEIAAVRFRTERRARKRGAFAMGRLVPTNDGWFTVPLLS
jgi:hypothetical protein